jgi:acyl dehydratase
MPLEYVDLKEGQELEPLVRPPITRVQLAKYAAASGDFNPMHLDDEFARKAGLDGVITHGMLNMGFLTQYMDALAGDNAELARLKVRFAAMSKPGDIVTCSGKVVKIYLEAGIRYAVFDIKVEKAPDQPLVTGEAVLRFL